MARDKNNIFDFDASDAPVDRSTAKVIKNLDALGGGVKKLGKEWTSFGKVMKKFQGVVGAAGLGAGFQFGHGDRNQGFSSLSSPYSGDPQSFLGGAASAGIQYSIYTGLAKINPLLALGAGLLAGPGLNRGLNAGAAFGKRKLGDFNQWLGDKTGYNAQSVWQNVDNFYGISDGLKSLHKTEIDWVDRVTGEKKRAEEEKVKEFFKIMTNMHRQ